MDDRNQELFDRIARLGGEANDAVEVLALCDLALTEVSANLASGEFGPADEERINGTLTTIRNVRGSLREAIRANV